MCDLYNKINLLAKRLSHSTNDQWSTTNDIIPYDLFNFINIYYSNCFNQLNVSTHILIHASRECVIRPQILYENCVWIYFIFQEQKTMARSPDQLEINGTIWHSKFHPEKLILYRIKLSIGASGSFTWGSFIVCKTFTYNDSLRDTKLKVKTIFKSLSIRMLRLSYKLKQFRFKL